MALFHAGLQSALDDDGNPIEGAVWKFYATGTSTPATAYEADLTTPLGVSVEADSSGRFPNVYFADGAFRAVLEDALGATIKDIDPANDYVAPSGDGDPIFTNVLVVGTVADAEVISPADDVDAIQTAGYYNAQDGGGGIYALSEDEPAHDGKFQTDNGDWWELASRRVNVRQFGARGDFDAVAETGTADTDAFNAAIQFARVKRDQIVPINGAAPGFVILIPDGDYYIDAGLDKISNPGGIVFLGESRGAVLWIESGTGTIFDFDPYGADALDTATGDGSTTVFAFDLPFAARAQDIWLYVDDVYTSAGFTSAMSDGGRTITYTFAVAPANAAALEARIAPYDVTNGGLANLTIAYHNSGTATDLICHFRTTTNCFLTDINVNKIGGLIQMGDADNFCSGTLLANIYGNVANVAGPVINAYKGAGLHLRGKIDVFNLASLPDQTSGNIRLSTSWSDASAPVAGRYFFRMGQGPWDTVEGRFTCLRFSRGAVLDVAAGAVVININMPGCVIDYNKLNAVLINVPTGAFCGNIKLADGYFVGWDDDAISVNGVGQTWGIHFHTGMIAGAGTNGFNIRGDGLNGCAVHNMDIFGAGRITGAATTGIYVHGAGENIDVQGCKTMVEPAVGGNLFTWEPAFGGYIGSDAVNEVRFEGNNLLGDTRNYEFEATAAANKRIIKGNQNANYTGLKTTGDPVFGSAFASPATGAEWVNKIGVAVDVHMKVVKAANLLILRNGATIVDEAGGGTYTGTWSLEPGETFAADYDTATFKFVLKA